MPGKTRLSGADLVCWLTQQVEAARSIKASYLASQARWPEMWTVQAQQMLDGASENLAYFERELGEAKCLQLRS